MKSSVFVLAHESGVDSAEIDANGLLRRTLDSLWSEAPASAGRIVVHATPALALTARREHAKRVQVIECTEGLGWGSTLNELVEASRDDTLVFLELGASVTPGWLRELAQASLAGGSMVGPRLPVASRESAQSASVPSRPNRDELRRAATRLRFGDPRFEDVETLGVACFGVSRDALDRVGRFDGRYASLEATVLDFQRRVRARGGRLLVARRALVHAEGSRSSLPPADVRALERRTEFIAAMSAASPPVALECESDDHAFPEIAALATGLLERGVPAFTFSRRCRVAARPGSAPHVWAPTLHAATQGASLVLLRQGEETTRRWLRLEWSESGSVAEPGVLSAPTSTAPESRASELDLFALRVGEAARRVEDQVLS